MNPPPLPSNRNPAPPPPPAPVPRKTSNSTVWIIVIVVCVVLFFGVGIFAAILIPTVSKVRQTARRTVDLSNFRQIRQSALLWATEHDGALPPIRIDANGESGGMVFSTIHGVAAALARDGGLNEASPWFATADHGIGTPSPHALTNVLDASKKLDASFAQQHGFAWDFATGLTTSMSSATPIAWTRGLRSDGTWDASAGVYGSDGGYIAFLGGNVSFFRDLRAGGGMLLNLDGTRTANILETLPLTVRIVGDGPGTLNGKSGLAPTK